MAIRINICWGMVVLFTVGCATTPNDSVPQVNQKEVWPSQDASKSYLPLHTKATPVSVQSNIVADERLQQELEPLRTDMLVYTQRVVGHLNGPLERGKPESTMGNFVTDAMRFHTAQITGVRPDFCFTNLGGLRVDLPAGDVTAGQVTELMPFDNSVIVFETSGVQTKKILDHLAKRGDPVSGLHYDVPGTNYKINGEPFNMDQVYRICTNDYVFGGGSRYPIAKDTSATYTGVLLRDAIEEVITQKSQEGGVTPLMDQRVRSQKKVD